MSTLFFCTLPSRSAEPLGIKTWKSTWEKPAKKIYGSQASFQTEIVSTKNGHQIPPLFKKKCRYIRHGVVDTYFKVQKLKPALRRQSNACGNCSDLSILIAEWNIFDKKHSLPHGVCVGTGIMRDTVPYFNGSILMALYYYEDLNLSTRALSQFLNDLFFWKNVSNNF
jgi:hypothetical protein